MANAVPAETCEFEDRSPQGTRSKTRRFEDTAAVFKVPPPVSVEENEPATMNVAVLAIKALVAGKKVEISTP